MDLPEIHRHWFEHKPIAGAAFHLNDPVDIVAGPHAGDGGSVIDLLSLTPVPRYLVELSSGVDVRVEEHSIRYASDDASNALSHLQRWYSQQTDGDWEHSSGVQIGTLDNPGWFVKVNLDGTDLLHRPYQEVRQHHSPVDWIHCRVLDGVFEGFGGPLCLERLLQTFTAWANAGASNRA
jgi:hypothetical protein